MGVTLKEYLESNFLYKDADDVFELNVANKNIDDLEGIEIFKNLSVLCCHSNNIKSLKPLKSLKKLEIIQCYHNKLETFEGLENSKNLKEIYSDNNILKDISNLKNCKSLIYLCVSNNKISDISVLKNLNLLEELYIENNLLSFYDYIPIINLKNLYSVNIDYGGGVSIYDENNKIEYQYNHDEFLNMKQDLSLMRYKKIANELILK